MLDGEIFGREQCFTRIEKYPLNLCCSHIARSPCCASFTSDATTSELKGVELIDVEADIVVTATRTTNGSPHIIKCMRTLKQRENYSSE